jgi:hypothetical protein
VGAHTANRSVRAQNSLEFLGSGRGIVLQRILRAPGAVIVRRF